MTFPQFSWIRAAATLLIPALVMATACEASSDSPRTFYIDFAHGSDDASGLWRTDAWRHAPGDPEAGGNPAKEALRPGDTLLFAGGVTYRGSIRLNASGEQGRPITYRGTGFGTGKAVISGRDEFPIKLDQCAGSAACSGVDQPGELRLVRLPIQVRASDQIALDGHLLELAQGPTPTDPFWFDDLENYESLAVGELKPTGAADAWSMRSAFVTKSIGSAPVHDLGVEIWVMPNAVTSTKASGYDAATGTLTTVGQGVKPYTDRPTKFALINHPRLIRRPFQFATIDKGARIVVRTPSSADNAKMEISRRQVAFDIAGQSHIAIEGFEILGFSADTTEWAKGSALVSASSDTKDITFQRNFVHDITSWSNAGAVHINASSGVSVMDNTFQRMWRGAGVVIGGNAKDIHVLRNEFDRISRTGVSVFGAQRIWIDHNALSGLMGHHGNGMALYLNNHDALVTNNSIAQAVRGITFHGGDDGQPNRITIRNNLFSTVGDSGSGIQSWGNVTKQVAIERNVLVVEGGRFALKLNASDKDLVVRKNLINGVTVNGVPPTDWVFEGNIFTAENYITSSSINQLYTARNAYAPRLRKSAVELLAGKAVDPRLCEALRDDTSRTNDNLTWLTQAERDSLSTGIGPADVCAQ